MNCEVQDLYNNKRYKILIVDDQQYILDMEQSFWKVIFPFLFWMFPCKVFKVEEQAIVNQLRESKREKTKSSILTLGGFAYFIGILLAPLMDYFNISITFTVSLILLIMLLILVATLYLFISHKHKKQLYDVVELETLEIEKLWVRPNSVKHVFKLVLSYIFLLVFVLLGFGLHFETGNIMMLLLGVGLWFVLLSAIRVTVQKGYTIVRFKD